MHQGQMWQHRRVVPFLWVGGAGYRHRGRAFVVECSVWSYRPSSGHSSIQLFVVWSGARFQKYKALHFLEESFSECEVCGLSYHEVSSRCVGTAHSKLVECFWWVSSRDGQCGCLARFRSWPSSGSATDSQPHPSSPSSAKPWRKPWPRGTKQWMALEITGNTSGFCGNCFASKTIINAIRNCRTAEIPWGSQTTACCWCSLVGWQVC